MTKYDDIINLPRPISKKHKPMPRKDRAAQFAPFKALVGLDDEVDEAARLVDKRIELDENEKEILNERLLIIAENITDRPLIRVTYFVPDEKKEGGRYVTDSASVKKLDTIEKTIVFTDGRTVHMSDIFSVELDF